MSGFNVLFIYLFIYKIRHQQNKDKIDNIKNTKAGAVHREELQLRDPKMKNEECSQCMSQLKGIGNTNFCFI